MHPMLKLFAVNRKRGFFKAEVSPAGDEATIYLYDMIVDSQDEADWWGGVAPETFVKALAGMSAPTIHLRVKSPGGSVFAARAMEQAIREHPSRIVTHVDGLAASAASFLILPSDEIIMAPGSFLMIHKAWTFAGGNADDFRKSADLLEQIDGSLVKSYAAKTQQPAEDIAAMMAAETWIEAERAVELGFADSVAAEPKSKKSAMAGAWDLSAFANAPVEVQTCALPPPGQPDRAALARAAAVRMLSPA